MDSKLGFRQRLGVLVHKIRSYHDLLAEEAFFSLALFSGFSIVLLVGRLYLTQRWQLGFLSWNLFLAWIPYGLSFFVLSRVRKYQKPPLWLLAPAALWLLFLPNCPYMITDFVHFRSTSGFYWWYDIFLYFASPSPKIHIGKVATQHERRYDDTDADGVNIRAGRSENLINIAENMMRTGEQIPAVPTRASTKVNT